MFPSALMFICRLCFRRVLLLLSCADIYTCVSALPVFFKHVLHRRYTGKKADI